MYSQFTYVCYNFFPGYLKRALHLHSKFAYVPPELMSLDPLIVGNSLINSWSSLGSSAVLSHSSNLGMPCLFGMFSGAPLNSCTEEWTFPLSFLLFDLWQLLSISVNTWSIKLLPNVDSMETWRKIVVPYSSKTVYMENSVLPAFIPGSSGGFFLSRWGRCSFSKYGAWPLPTEDHKN